MNVALIDAGPMISLFDKQSVAHEHYSRELSQGWLLTTTWACVVEASHFLNPLNTQRFLNWIANGAVTVYPFDVSHLSDMAKLMQTYTEWPRTEMDLADATLVWLAVETQTNRIMTLDVRDFSRYRLPNGQAFEII
jgi:uncharacterized protein